MPNRIMGRKRLWGAMLAGTLAIAAGCGNNNQPGSIPKVSGSYHGVAVFYHLPDTLSGDTLFAFANITQGENGSLAGNWKIVISKKDSLFGTFEDARVSDLSTDGTDQAPLQFRLHVGQAACSGDFVTTSGVFARLLASNLFAFEGAIRGGASCYKFGAQQRGVFVVLGTPHAPDVLQKPGGSWRKS